MMLLSLRRSKTEVSYKQSTEHFTPAYGGGKMHFKGLFPLIINQMLEQDLMFLSFPAAFFSDVPYEESYRE